MTESKSTSVLLPPRSELLLIGLLLLLWGMFLLRKLLLLLLLACLVAAALYPAVQWLNNKHIPRKLSILLCYSLIVLLMIGIGFLLSDIIVEQGQALVVSLPAFVDNVVERINLLPIVGADEQWSAAISNNTRMIIVQALDFLQRAFNYLIVIFQGFFGIITVLVFTFFLLADTDYFQRTTLQLVPVAKRNKIEELLKTVAAKAGAYARGQLLVMTATGVLTGLGLYFLGVPYALTLGVITFILDIVPILGPFIAAGFGIIVALAQDPMLALWTALLYLIVQQMENNFLSPMILGKSVGLNSFWILLSIFAGGALFGIIGVILAVPTAVAIGLLIEEFYIKDYIEKRS